MTAPTIRMLHVEDDAYQQQTIARFLRQMGNLNFDITCAESETAAVEAFRQSPHDLVIMDYHLTQGDGLSCLRTLRQQDPFVPIIAISGTASTVIAAELLQSGADDYFSKCDLSVKGLERSVRLALARAEAYRRRQLVAKTPAAPIDTPLYELCKFILQQLGPEYRQRMATVARTADEAGLLDQQLAVSFEAACRRLQQEAPFTSAELKAFLQPIHQALRHRPQHN